MEQPKGFADQGSNMDFIGWVQSQLTQFGFSTSTSTTLFMDSQRAIAKNPIVRGRSKHIDVLFHFVRDYIADGRISLDLLPKPLHRPTLDHLL